VRYSNKAQTREGGLLKTQLFDYHNINQKKTVRMGGEKERRGVGDREGTELVREGGVPNETRRREGKD